MDKGEMKADRNKRLLHIVESNRGKWLSVASIHAEIGQTELGYRTSERTVGNVMWKLHCDGHVEHMIRLGIGSMYRAKDI